MLAPPWVAPRLADWWREAGPWLGAFLNRRASALSRWAPLELEWAAQGRAWRDERREDRTLLLVQAVIAAVGGKSPGAERWLGRALGATRMPLFRPLPEPRRRWRL